MFLGQNFPNFCYFWTNFGLCLNKFGQLLMFSLKLHLKSGAQVARKECTILRSGVDKIEKRISC